MKNYEWQMVSIDEFNQVEYFDSLIELNDFTNSVKKNYNKDFKYIVRLTLYIEKKIKGELKMERDDFYIVDNELEKFSYYGFKIPKKYVQELEKSPHIKIEGDQSNENLA